jgi:hypothetical protein
MKLLDDIHNYRSTDDEDEDEVAKRNRLIMFNYQDPARTLFKELQGIPASSVPSVLKFLHMKYLPILIRELKTTIAT